MGHKIVLDPKKVMSFASSKEPVTLEHLAEVEKNILKILNALEEEYLTKADKDNKNDNKEQGSE
jgi:hypothetical protein